jgi:flagellar biosynthetic protein FlhB
MAEGAEDRTEAATPTRLLRAKTEGNAPVARELPMFAGLVAAALMLATSISGETRHLLLAMADSLAGAGEPIQSGSAMQPLWTLLAAGFHIVVPVGAASAAAIAGAHLLQTGFRPKLSALRADLSRISPMGGMKRLFGVENAVAAFKAIVKIGLIGSMMFWLILTQDDQIMNGLVAGPSQMVHLVSKAVFGITGGLLGVQGLIALADLAWTRVHFVQAMRMSHTEVKDEAKDADGNPHVKARLRKLIAARNRPSLKTAMSRATVVITNPTHYAVALDYQQGQTEAPKIVAKGAGDLAARIRALAYGEGVPVVSNPPLARALFKLELESEIPAEHYKAVAEIIAYVWRLSGRFEHVQRRL